MCTDVLRAACARAVPRRTCAACADPDLPHRPRLGAAGPRRCSAPRPAARWHSDRLAGVFPDCDARQERDGLVRGAAAVLGCSLVAVAALTGDAVEGTNGERKAAGSPPLRPWPAAPRMPWPDAPCGGLACI